MTETMDLDLWSLPASIGVGCDDDEYGCESEFDFCYAPDAMEEDAINEKCCVEVLKRLIAKEDAEIFDLEDDLAILKGQLSWAKHDGCGKFYEVWTAAFREKITSLSRSLQTLRKGHALNPDSGINHEPAERIHDIITALLKHNFQTEIKKEHIISKADTEARGNTSASTASMGLSRPDKKQIIGSKNQPVINAIREAKGLQVSEVRLAQKHGLNMPNNSTFDRKERSTISMLDCPKKVLNNDIKDGSFASEGAKKGKGSEAAAMPLKKISEGTDEVDPTLTADSLWPSVKVEFDEHEPLITYLNSQGSKRKKLQSTPSISRTEIWEEENEEKPIVNGTTARSKLLPASEGDGRRFGIGRKGKLPGRTNENSNHISGLTRNARSQAALPAEIKNVSMSSQSAGLKGGTKYGPLEKHAQEAVIASERTRNKLDSLNRSELCAIAKNHALKGISKLKKSSIVDMIECHLGICFADSCTT